MRGASHRIVCSAHDLIRCSLWLPWVHLAPYSRSRACRQSEVVRDDRAGLFAHQFMRIQQRWRVQCILQLRVKNPDLSKRSSGTGKQTRGYPNFNSAGIMIDECTESAKSMLTLYVPTSREISEWTRRYGIEPSGAITRVSCLPTSKTLRNKI